MIKKKRYKFQVNLCLEELSEVTYRYSSLVIFQLNSGEGKTHFFFFIFAVKRSSLLKYANWKVGILATFPNEWKYKITVCNTMLVFRFSAR